MNKYKIKISELDQRINIPLKIEYDLTGQEDLISQYEDSVTEQLINPIKKFETQRFSHGTVSEGVANDITIIFIFSIIQLTFHKQVILIQTFGLSHIILQLIRHLLVNHLLTKRFIIMRTHSKEVFSS